MPRLLDMHCGWGGLSGGLLAGAAGGVIGTLVMSRTEQALRARLISEPAQGDPPPVRMAGKLSLILLGRPPKPTHNARNGRLVSYGFGSAFAASYGVLSQIAPVVTAGRGVAFGAAVWVAGDGLVTPWLGVAEPPFRQPAREAGIALAAHLVYGLAVEQVRALARR